MAETEGFVPPFSMTFNFHDFLLHIPRKFKGFCPFRDG